MNPKKFVKLKRAVSKLCIFTLLTFTGLLIMPVATPGSDLPSGPDVKIGSPSITVDNKEMIIDAGNFDKTWIDWQGGFNIGVENTVNNIGPSPAAAMLHNDISGAISDIQGILNGNCQVFLLNPNGILFSPTAQVNVAALVASTLMMSHDDFLAGNYIFRADGIESLGTVINAGTINAGTGGVTLMGGAIQNAGMINADLGTVNLVAGREVTLNISGDGSIQAAVNKEILNNVYDQDGEKVNVGVENLGTITADGGKVYIEVEAVQDIFDTLINQEGIVRAGSMVERDGKIILVSDSDGIIQNTGTLDASAIEAGAKGGTVHVLGDKVGILDNATIDVSGDRGGGIVLVGGDFQGKGEVPNASRTYVGSDTTIKADAITDGDGGKVIVWADEITGFYGDISARGGAESGDGGFVEVSGKLNLDFDGHVDMTAPNGEMGTLLLDPIDIVIDVGGGDGANGGDILYADAPGAEPWNVTSAALDAIAGNIILEAHDDITVSDALSLATGGATLTMRAGDDIIIDANVSTTNAAIDMTANHPGGNQADTGTAGVITMANGTTVDAGSSTISLMAQGDITLGGLITTSASATAVTLTSTEGGIVDGGVAHVDVNAANGTLVIDAVTGVGSADAIETTVATIDIDNQTSGDILIVETDDLNINRIAQATTGDVNVTVSAGNIVVVAAQSGITTAGGGSVTLTATDGASEALIDVNDLINAGGNITLDANGTGQDAKVDVDAALTAGGTLDIDVDVSVGDNTASAEIGTATAQADGNITITSDDNITIASMVDSTGGTTAIGNDAENIGTVTINAVVRGTTVTLDADDGAGTITITTDPNNTRGNITVNAVSTFNLNANLSALNNIGVTPATTLGASSTVTSTSGDVTFTGAVNGSWNLVVSSANGTTTFGSTVGNATPLDILTVAANAASLGGNISTDNDGNVTFTNTETVTLGAAVTIDTDTATGVTAAGDILFSPTGTVTGAFDFDLDATADGGGANGAVTLGTVDTASLDIDTTGITTLWGNITADDDVTLTGATNVDLAADVTILGDGTTNVILNSTGDVVGDFDLAIDAGNGTVTLGLAATETEIDVNKLTVTNTGQTNIAGDIEADEGIDFSNATNVDMTTAVVLTNTDSGTVDLSGGDVDAAGALDIAASATNVRLGVIDVAAGAEFDVDSTGTTTIVGNLTTVAGNVAFDGATNIVLGADVAISTGAAAGGNIDFVDGAGNNTLSGNFDLTLNAGTGNIEIDNVSNIASLTVTDSTSTIFSGIATVAGAVDVNATSIVDATHAVIQVASTGSLTTTSGTITLDADGENSTGGQTTNATINIDGPVSAGGVLIFDADTTNADDTALIDIDADVSGNLTLTSGDNVEIDGDVTTTGSNTIIITADTDSDNTGDVTIGTSADDAIVQSVDGLIDIDGENVTLGGAGTNFDGRVLTTGEGAVDIDTVSAFTIADTNADNSAIVAGGNITVDSSSSTIITTGVINSTSGSVELTAAGNITLGGVVSADGDSGTVTIIKSGTGAGDIVTSAAINTHGTNGTVSITNNGDGGLDDITIGGAITTASGNVDVTTTSGVITLNSAITTGSTGAVAITAGGTDDGDIDMNAGIITSSGSVSLQADDDIFMSHNDADITSVSGSIDIDAGLGALTGAITMNGPSIIQTSEGNIVMDAEDIITLGQLVATVGTADVTSSAATIIGAVDGTTEITAPTVDLDAVVGIGAADTSALDLSGTTSLAADLSGAGNIYIDNAATGAVNVTSMTVTGAGLIDYEQTGNQQLTLTTVTTSNGNITINNTGGTSADVLIGAVTADITDDTVIINATGSMDDASSDSTADITSDVVDLDAIEGIGNTRAIELASVKTITADTTNGDIDLDNVANEAVTISSMTTGTGSINYDQTVAAGTGFGLLVARVAVTDGDISLSNAGSAGDITDIGADITVNDIDGDTTDGVVTLNSGLGGDIINNASNTIDAYTLTIASALIVGADSPADNLVDANWLDIDVTNLNITTAGASYIDEVDDINALDVTVTGELGIDAAGTVTLTKVSAAAQNVLIVTTTNVVDGGDTDTDVTSSLLSIDAETGIGSSNALDTAVTYFVGETDGGNVQLTNTGALTLSDNSVATSVTDGVRIIDVGTNDDLANIVIRAASPLTVTEAVTNADGGDITLASEGTAAADILTIGADITASGGAGDVYLYAGYDVLQTAGDVLAAGAGNISVYAGTDYNGGAPDIKAGNADADVTQSGGRDMTTTSGTITIQATEDVTLSILSTSGNVNVTADDSTYGLDDNSGAIAEQLAGDVAANIIGSTATLRAATGIGSADVIETNITNLDALNTTSGNIQVTEIAAGTTLNIRRATQQSPDGAANAGNIAIQTANGTLTVVADYNGVTAVDTGTVTLIAGDSDSNEAEDLAINDTVTSNTGKITLTSSGDDVTFGAGGDVTSTSGEIEVNATNDDGDGIIDMADGTVLNAGSGTIDLNANANIDIGSLVTTSTSNTAVTIDSAEGALTDGGNTDVDVVANSGRLVINVVTGVGSGAAIETTVSSIDVDNTGSNNIEINETDAITVIELDQDAATGTIVLTAGGTITVEDSGSSGVGVIAVGGAVSLDANGTASSIALEHVVQTGGNAAITITADDDVTFTAAGDVTATGSGNVIVTADADSVADGDEGKITMADDALINADGGTITLSADENIALGGLLTTNDTGSAVSITSTSGAITDAGDAHTDIEANSTNAVVTISAVTGVGTTDAIDTEVATIYIDNNTSGDIRISELSAGGNLAVTRAVMLNPSGPLDGDIDIRTVNGALTISGTVSTAMDGTIVLLADGAANGDLTVNAGVTSVSGNITLTADDDVTFSVDGDVTSTTGNVAVTAGVDGTADGLILMVDNGSTDATLINAGSGTITMTAERDITLGGLLTTNSTNTAVVLNTTEGGIVDGGDYVIDVVAADGRLVIDAVTGVGSAGNIETTVGSIDVDNATSGDIDINETNAITVIQLDQDAATGTVNLDAGGTITIAATADSGVGVSSLAGQVELDATGATSDIYVYNTITTTSGAINVLADNDVIFTIAGDITSTSGNVTVTADADATADAGQGGAITMADNNETIAAVADATIINAGSGLIALNADEDITIARLITTHNVAGDTEVRIISTSGAIVDAGDSGAAALNEPDIEVDTANGAVSISALTGIGTDANAIETEVRELAATTTSGDITIDNTDALTIVNATGYTPAGVNGVTITGGGTSDNITITATSPLTVSAVVSDTGGGAIVLAAEGSDSADDLTVNANITAAGGNGSISLYAGHDVLHNTAGTIQTAGTGAINIYAGVDYNSGTPQAGHATGNVTQADDLTIQSTGTGAITITATENVALTIVSTGGTVTITADDNTYSLSDNSGAITDALSTEAANITGTTATLRAATGIGSADDIDTNITTLDAVNSTSGNLLVTEIDTATGDLDVNQAAQTALGNLLVQTLDGTLTVVADQSGVATTTGTLTLIAGDADSGYTDDLVINDTVTTTTGNITLTSSGDDVTFGAGGDVTSTSGNVDVNASNTDTTTDLSVIFMADGAVINSGTGTIDMDAYSDITLGGLTTTNTGATAVAVTSAAGGIVDGGDTDVDIVANTASATVDLDAVTGIGSANALETTIYNLEATNTTSGNIKINETDAINLTEVINSAAGSIDVTAAGTITTTTVTASGGAVNLWATAGNIFDTAGGLITGTALSSLRASGIIGTAVSPYNPIDVNINGDLWVWAGSQQNQVSVITQGTVVSTAATERVEIYEPSPPGLVIHDNHLMGGGNYGSGSTGGSILSRGYGEMQAIRVSMFNLFYDRALQPWGYQISTPWVPSECALIDEEFLLGPVAVIDGSEIGIDILPSGLLITPERFEPSPYYIIRTIK